MHREYFEVPEETAQAVAKAEASKLPEDAQAAKDLARQDGGALVFQHCIQNAVR